MQKKNLPDTSASSNWAENVKKQQKDQSAKKYIVWAGIIAVCVLAFVGLVYFANKSGASAITAGQPVPNLPKVSSSDIIEGNKNAPVTLYEYADLQCPACAAYNPLVNQVLNNYKGKVRVVFRFFPLIGTHSHAALGTQAAYAGFKMGKFKELKDMMFDKQPEWSDLSDSQAQDKFVSYAKSLGLSGDKFRQTMDSTQAQSVAQKSYNDATKLGLRSTPTFFLDGKSISPGGYNDFQSLIDQELKTK